LTKKKTGEVPFQIILRDKEGMKTLLQIIAKQQNKWNFLLRKIKQAKFRCELFRRTKRIA
jgi:hypothetical protein